jgi:hypothetical protein
MYSPAAIWVEGTVVSVEAINPHSITTLETPGADGQLRRWAVEGPGQSQIERMGIGMDSPRVGDTIRFCAFPYKSAEELTRLFPAADFSARLSASNADVLAPQYLAGHVMLRSDGSMRLWEPHGVLGACILSSDRPRQAWLDFLSSNTQAMQAWCEQREYSLVQSNADLREFVEAINAAIDDPC